jgi:hypothetical protein
MGRQFARSFPPKEFPYRALRPDRAGLRFACRAGDDECNPKGFNERTHHQLTGMVELRSMSIGR